MNKPIHFATKQLEQYRLDRDWTKTQMAQFITLQTRRPTTRQDILRWETQKTGIKAEVVLQLASVLHVPVMQLVEQR